MYLYMVISADVARGSASLADELGTPDPNQSQS